MHTCNKNVLSLNVIEKKKQFLWLVVPSTILIPRCAFSVAASLGEQQTHLELQQYRLNKPWDISHFGAASSLVPIVFGNLATAELFVLDSLVFCNIINRRGGTEYSVNTVLLVCIVFLFFERE